MSKPPANSDYLRFRDGFAGAIDLKLYTIEWLDAQVASGAFRPLASPNACILVSLRTYPTGVLELHGEAATGDLQEIIQLIDLAVSWAREHGCALATIASRPGWARVLDGWETRQIELRKEL